MVCIPLRTGTGPCHCQCTGRLGSRTLARWCAQWPAYVLPGHVHTHSAFHTVDGVHVARTAACRMGTGSAAERPPLPCHEPQTTAGRLSWPPWAARPITPIWPGRGRTPRPDRRSVPPERPTRRPLLVRVAEHGAPERRPGEPVDEKHVDAGSPRRDIRAHRPRTHAWPGPSPLDRRVERVGLHRVDEVHVAALPATRDLRSSGRRGGPTAGHQ